VGDEESLLSRYAEDVRSAAQVVALLNLVERDTHGIHREAAEKSHLADIGSVGGQVCDDVRFEAMRTKQNSLVLPENCGQHKRRG
jgi:hypothetical protein